MNLAQKILFCSSVLLLGLTSSCKKDCPKAQPIIVNDTIPYCALWALRNENVDSTAYKFTYYNLISKELAPSLTNVLWLKSYSSEGVLCDSLAYWADSVQAAPAIFPKIDLYIPNSFSPNNDGVNDVWKIALNGNLFANYSLTVYNRWGELVFSSTHLDQSWNGKDLNGDSLSAQTYSYMLKADFFAAKTDRFYRLQKTGTVTLFN